MAQHFRSAGLFRSADAGLAWDAVPSARSGSGSLLFVPSPSGLALYEGGRGAVRSLDGGLTWSPIEGVPGGTVYAIAGGADAERAVVYISTEAGMGAGGPAAGMRAAAVPQVMPGGIYGLTQRLLSHRSYLPLLSRAP